MSLGHQPAEQRVGVAFARTLAIIAIITLLGWVFSREPVHPENAGSQSPDAGVR